MHYFFLDASALGKRYVVEIGTPLINHLFDTVSKTRMLALLLGVGEIVSILVRRRNAGQISEKAFQQAMAEFRAEVIDAPDFSLQSVTDDWILASLPLIEQHALNATDAIILRCALQVADTLRQTDDDLVMITSDVRLVRAAQRTGLITWNPEVDTQSALDTLVTQQ